MVRVRKRVLKGLIIMGIFTEMVTATCGTKHLKSVYEKVLVHMRVTFLFRLKVMSCERLIPLNFETARHRFPKRVI